MPGAIDETGGCDVKIVLPLPSSKLSQNARVHWRTRANETKKMRGYAKYAAIAAINELIHTDHGLPWKSATVKCSFFFAKVNRRDKANFDAMCKPIWDGFTDAGLWVDDDQLTHLPTELAIDKNDPRLEIEVNQS